MFCHLLYKSSAVKSQYKWDSDWTVVLRRLSKSLLGSSTYHRTLLLFEWLSPKGPKSMGVRHRTLSHPCLPSLFLSCPPPPPVIGLPATVSPFCYRNSLFPLYINLFLFLLFRARLLSTWEDALFSRLQDLQ